jgi:hypothetical protein
MPTDWKSLEKMERLVAALIASNGGKVSDFLPPASPKVN